MTEVRVTKKSEYDRAERFLARAVEAETRLATVTKLMKDMPIQAAGSSEEPWATIASINFTKIIEVAEGKTDPSEWVSVPCPYATGVHKKPADGPRLDKFDHSPHWYSDYITNEWGGFIRRDTHWCDGVVQERGSRGTSDD